MSETKKLPTKLEGPRFGPASGGKPTSIVAILHGYGSDGNDLIGLGQALAPILPDTLFVAPNGPQACAINPAGYEWFPLDMNAPQGHLGLAESVRPLVRDYLHAELAAAGLSEKDMILAGFSQGAMMALHVGLQMKTALAGIVAFSGGLVSPDNLDKRIISKPPVCLVHGDSDEVVPTAATAQARRLLKENNVPVQAHISPNTGHSIAPDGLNFAAAFMVQLLKSDE